MIVLHLGDRSLRVPDALEHDERQVIFNGYRGFGGDPANDLIDIARPAHERFGAIIADGCAILKCFRKSIGKEEEALAGSERESRRLIPAAAHGAEG